MSHAVQLFLSPLPRKADRLLTAAKLREEVTLWKPGLGEGCQKSEVLRDLSGGG